MVALFLLLSVGFFGAGCVGGAVGLLIGLGELVMPLVKAQGGIGSVWGLFWCAVVPCPCYPGMRRQFWPYVPGCWGHFVLLWCGGCCPNVSIDLCGWVSCILWCWRCCLVVWWLECPKRGVSPVVLVPLWTGCVGPGCWCVVVSPDCVLPCWWQRCHLQTWAKGKGVGEGGEGLYFKLFHKDVCYEGADVAAPCTCS